MKAATASAAWLGEKLLMTVLLTVGVGPLIGTVIFVLGAGLSPKLGLVFLALSMPSGLIAMAAQSESILTLILLGYVAGGIQATICGLIFATHGWLFGRLPVWVPVVAALIMAGAFNFAFFGLAIVTLVFSVALHLVPALVTWWLVKAYWQKEVA